MSRACFAWHQFTILDAPQAEQERRGNRCRSRVQIRDVRPSRRWSMASRVGGGSRNQFRRSANARRSEKICPSTRWRPTCRHQQLSLRTMRLPRPETMKKATPGLATILLTTSHDRPRRTSNPRRSNTCLRDHRNAHRRGIPSSLPPLHADRPTPVTMGGS